jgi:hypothetical protein
MTRKDSEGMLIDTDVAVKTGKNGNGAAVGIQNERVVERMSGDNAEENHFPDLEPDPPAKAARRPWAWAVLGVAAAVGIGGGVYYYLYSLSYESTDDAFIDGHVVPVSARVAGYVAKVHVTDNQWVSQGDLLAELDPNDYEARLAGSEAALAAARAGRQSRSIGVDVTEITSTAGVGEASAAVEGAKAAVETARAAVATAKSQHAQTQAQLIATEAAVEQARADLLAAEARRQPPPRIAWMKPLQPSASPKPTWQRCGKRSKRKKPPSSKSKPPWRRPRAGCVRPSLASPGGWPPREAPRLNLPDRSPRRNRWPKAVRRPTSPKPRRSAPKPRPSRPG